MSIEDLKAKIAKEKIESAERIEKFERMIREEQARQPDQNLAIALHSALCHWNHEDQCGWFYEIRNEVHNWNGSSHSTYLEKAQKLMTHCKIKRISPESALEIFHFIKKV